MAKKVFEWEYEFFVYITMLDGDDEKIIQDTHEQIPVLLEKFPLYIHQISPTNEGTTSIKVAIKLALQYWDEVRQPIQKIFITRNYYQRSNPLNPNALRISSCDSYRGKVNRENNYNYIARLAAELDSMIQGFSSRQVATFILKPIVNINHLTNKWLESRYYTCRTWVPRIDEEVVRPPQGPIDL
ncbi:hypothetical protein GQ44DRAFT_722552 [Phaeosphaeriaceae sp. PMI808]|nr:hypothetical protein GQ44DRAFT_722552 [Phaeosphaeriaceae sp. PMI808]